jgi:hypothetical protein
MRTRELRNPIRQIGYAGALRPPGENMIEAPEPHRRQIVAVRIAWPPLHRARDADVPLGPRVVRGDVPRGHGPVDVNPVERCSPEVQIGEPGRGASPEVRLAAGHLHAEPLVLGAGGGGVRDVVLPESFGVLGLVVVPHVFRPRIAEAAKRHVVSLPVIAKVPCGFDTPARV